MPNDELLDETVDDAETIVVSWLKDLLPQGHVAYTRKPAGPLPFYLVTHLDADESVEESYRDALVSVHVLTHKSAGGEASRDEADRMHRRMLLQARYLEDVSLPLGRTATIDYLDVVKAPKREEYGDDLILRRVARYKLGLCYVQAQ